MKKKLLFINGHLNTGGVEKALLDVLRHMDYDQYEVDLLLLEELGDYASLLPPQVNVRLCSLKNTYGSVRSSLVRCIRQKDWFCVTMRLIFLGMKFFGQKHISWSKNLLTGGKHYDCVVGFRTGICSQIAAFACNADRRITWWHHGEINVDPASYLEMAADCDGIAVVSDACRKMLEDAFPTLGPKFVTIPNMLDEDEIMDRAKAFDPGWDREMLHIVSVGRLAEEKHFENAIYAAQKLKEQGIAFRWHLVGDGAMREKLQEQAIQFGVTDCFIFEGNQPNPYPYLKHADLFVHPSYVESFGIVVAEAMALKIPCVATKSIGPCEFIEDGVNGILTEQNADSLAEKVINILTDREKYEYMQQQTRCPARFLSTQVIGLIEMVLEN